MYAFTWEYKLTCVFTSNICFRTWADPTICCIHCEDCPAGLFWQKGKDHFYLSSGYSEIDSMLDLIERTKDKHFPLCSVPHQPFEVSLEVDGEEESVRRMAIVKGPIMSIDFWEIKGKRPFPCLSGTHGFCLFFFLLRN